MEASNEYQGNSWLAYDRHFRQCAASQPNSKWSNIDTTVWKLAFTGAGRCIHCFSLFHKSKEYKFVSSPALSLSEPQHQHQAPYRCHYICQHWNEQYGQGCSFRNCRYKHVCYHCAYNPTATDINHKAIFCPNCPAPQVKTLQQPKPLFPWSIVLGNFGHNQLMHTLVCNYHDNFMLQTIQER